MSLYFQQAWRNIWRHKRRTLIVVFAIGSSMAMMMMYDGLVAGFENAIYGNAIRVLGGNIQVHAEGYSDEAGQKPFLPLPNDLALCRRSESAGFSSSQAGAVGSSGLLADQSTESRNSVQQFRRRLLCARASSLPRPRSSQHAASGAP